MSDTINGMVHWILFAIPYFILFGLCAFIVFRMFEKWRPSLSKIELMWIGSLGTIAIGLPYVFYLYGPQEAEVTQWERIAIVLGILLLEFSWLLGEKRSLVSKLILGLGFSGAAILQVPPVVLWLTLRVTTDNAPPYSLVTAGLFAAPHLLLFVACAFVVFLVSKGKLSNGPYKPHESSLVR